MQIYMFKKTQINDWSVYNNAGRRSGAALSRWKFCFGAGWLRLRFTTVNVALEWAFSKYLCLSLTNNH